MCGGVVFLEEGLKGIGYMLFGILFVRIIGVGIGIGIVYIDKLYVFIIVDILYFGKLKKIFLIVVGLIGYGFYNNVSLYFIIKGGFIGFLNVGIVLLVCKLIKFFLMGGYLIYSFSGGCNIFILGYMYKVKDNI